MKLTRQIKFMGFWIVALFVTSLYAAPNDPPAGGTLPVSETTQSQKSQSNQPESKDSKQPAYSTTSLSNDRYENWLPREEDAKEIFDEKYLGKD
jgi:hypothetical protein